MAILWEGRRRGLPAGARLAMAFGTLTADLWESSANRSPEPAVLFYATGDDRAGEEVERLIRTAGFEPVKAGGIEHSGRLEVGGGLIVSPPWRGAPLRPGRPDGPDGADHQVSRGTDSSIDDEADPATTNFPPPPDLPPSPRILRRNGRKGARSPSGATRALAAVSCVPLRTLPQRHARTSAPDQPTTAAEHRRREPSDLWS
jgi:hypothetical protein